MLLVILGVALGLASPFMVMQFQRRRDVARAGRGSARVTRAEAMRPANPFAAVSIRPCLEDPCDAVVKMADQRFLAVRAPSLPVPGCGRRQCGCRYARHADRRSPSDRRDSFARFGGLRPTTSKDQRSPRVDRRKSR
jgi:tRNA(Ile)-lysidine synthase TilS/MesJ